MPWVLPYQSTEASTSSLPLTSNQRLFAPSPSGTVPLHSLKVAVTRKKVTVLRNNVKPIGVTKEGKDASTLFTPCWSQQFLFPVTTWQHLAPTLLQVEVDCPSYHAYLKYCTVYWRSKGKNIMQPGMQRMMQHDRVIGDLDYMMCRWYVNCVRALKCLTHTTWNDEGVRKSNRVRVPALDRTSPSLGTSLEL